MRPLLLAASVFVATTGLVACGSSATSTTDGDGGAPSGPSASSGAPGASTGQCTSMAQESVSVDVTRSSAAAPASKGGTIVDGTYVLTRGTCFPDGAVSCSSQSLLGAETLLITGATYQVIRADSINGQLSRASGTFVTDGTYVTLIPKCESPAPPPDSTDPRSRMFSYTATPTTLTLTIFNSSLEQVYTKK